MRRSISFGHPGWNASFSASVSPPRSGKPEGPPVRGGGKASRRELAPQARPEGQRCTEIFHLRRRCRTQLGASHARPAPPRWTLLEPHGGYMLTSLALTDGDANGALAQWPRPAPPRFGVGTGLCALDGPLISVRLPVADPLPPPSGKVFFLSLSLLVAPGGTGSLASWPTHRVSCVGEYVRGGSLRTVEACRRVPPARFASSRLYPGLRRPSLHKWLRCG